MYVRYQTGAEGLSLDWDALSVDASEGGASAFDASGYSGTLLGSMGSGGDPGWGEVTSPGYAPSSQGPPAQSQGGGGGSDDALFGMLGQAFGMLGKAIPSIAGDSAKTERAEAMRLERERLLAAQKLGFMPGQGGAPQYGQSPQRGYAGASMGHGSNPSSGMSTGTMIALGVGAAGLVWLLWPKKTQKGEGES